jgi:predicted nucleotidyltransferase
VVAVDQEQCVDALRRLGIADEVLKDVPVLSPEIRGLLVYGSQARGDAVPGSDVDLLALVDQARPSTYSGDVNVSYYTAQQLATGIGTLFGAHLNRDAKILSDPSGELAHAIRAMGSVDTARLFARALSMTELFTTPERDLPKYLPGLLREARYLLRSSLYAEAIAAGQPCFSVRELAKRHEDPQLADLLSSRPREEAQQAELDDCLTRLQRMLGEFPPSQHGSLEATIVNEWNRPSDLLSMAFMALGITGDGSDYAEVDKILL